MKRKVRIIEQVDRQVIKKNGEHLMLRLTKNSGLLGLVPRGSKVRVHRVEGGFFVEVPKIKS
jgi:hypothetical protein